MSLVQGGTGFPFFAQCVYDYLCGKYVSTMIVGPDQIPDPEVTEMLRKVIYDPIY